MINLTGEERRVVLFLTAVGFIGVGVNFLIKLNTPFKVLACYSETIGKIDLNSANGSLLASAPGIGTKLAQRIIEYRIEQGGFKQIEELRNIKGITNYRYEQLKSSFIIK